MTRTRGLTVLGIESLTAGEYGDTGSTSGLRLRVGGREKVFRYYIHTPEGRKVITLGRWVKEPQPGALSLAEARAWFLKLKEARLAGPEQLARTEAELRASLATAPVVPSGKSADSVERIAEKWLATLKVRRKRPEVAEAILKNDILPVIGHRPLASLRPSDAMDLVEAVVSGVGRPSGRGAAPTHAAKVLGVLKQLLAYGSKRLDIASPAALLKADDFAIVMNESDRWLDAEKELPVLWNVLEQAQAPGGVEPVEGVHIPEAKTCAALQLLLLTGVRSNELRLARWEHVDLDAATWTVPVANQKLSPKQAKQARDFVVALSEGAVARFRRLRSWTEGPWVLSSGRLDEPGPYTDKVLGRAMRRLWTTHPLLKGLPLATPHDLRRSCRSYLGHLEVPDEVAERVLNHSLGRIRRTYNRTDGLEPRREAMARLWSYVESMTSQGTAKVAFIAGRR